MLYPLPGLLLCCLAGVLCDAEGWVEVEEYGEAKLDFLWRFLPFEHGIADHDTFSDVFNALDPLRHVSDGRGARSRREFPGHPAAHPPAAGATCTSVRVKRANTADNQGKGASR